MFIGLELMVFSSSGFAWSVHRRGRGLVNVRDKQTRHRHLITSYIQPQTCLSRPLQAWHAVASDVIPITAATGDNTAFLISCDCFWLSGYKQPNNTQTTTARQRAHRTAPPPLRPSAVDAARRAARRRVVPSPLRATVNSTSVVVVVGIVVVVEPVANGARRPPRSIWLRR
jgi:hypothetical protein